MVYLGPAPRGGDTNQPLRGNIDPSLPVASVGANREGHDLPYWPDYASITPRARATYLDWLATGRSDPGIGVGYVFLYFYGLERRFFLEVPDRSEREALIVEAERLVELYGANYSARSYLSRFLDAARAVMGGEASIDFSPDHRTGTMPLPLQIGLSQLMARGDALGADHLLAWWVHHPETSFRTAARRVFPELRAMFGHLFSDRFPDGLKVALPRKKLKPIYQAASGQFTSDLTACFGDVRDISTTRKPVEIAAEIVEEACTALDRFSRLLGKDEDARPTLAAHLALPPQLRAQFPNEAARTLETWASGVVDGGGLASQLEMFERTGRAAAGEVGKRDFVEAKVALAAMGFGLAPDPEHGIRRPKTGEPISIYRLPEPSQFLETVCPTHSVVQVSILLGSFVAHADGQALAGERQALVSLIDAAPDLSAVERAHLHASLTWALAVSPDLSLLTRRMKDASMEAKRELGRLALIVAAVDGTLDPREVAAVERLHKALGLDASGIYASLHALAGEAEPITVRSADPGAAGRAIPLRPLAAAPRPRGLQLDRARISAVMADTAHVSKVLGGIFEDPMPPAVVPVPEPEPAAEDAAGFEGLDPTYHVFLAELLGRDHWPDADFAALAARYRLMTGGAVEALNEWSFERFDAALLEEHEGYEIDPGLAERLRA